MFCPQSAVTLFVWLCKTAIISLYYTTRVETCDGAVGWGTALQAGRSRVLFSMVPLEFFVDLILQIALWPWGRLSLQQNWVPRVFPGGKGSRCIWLTIFTTFTCADCLEVWDSKPPGTLRMSSLLIYILHQHICFYNWDGVCLLCGTNGIFKCIGG